MSFQTYVLVANLGEAQTLADTEDPIGSTEGFSYQAFDRVKLCTLLSLLKTDDPSTAFDQYLNKIEVVNSSLGEWPTVSVVPDELVGDLSSIAGLEESAFESLAKNWVGTEEFEGWSFEDVRQLLRELGDLAESASLESKCLLIWESP